MSASNFKGAGAKSELGGDKIVKILTAYPMLNPDFLLMNDPEMYRHHETQELTDSLQVYSLRTDSRVSAQDVPLYNLEASAGLMSLFENKQNIIDHIHVPNLPKADGAIYVRGDSMYPLLKSGDIVIYKHTTDMQDGFIWGEMYVLSATIGGEEQTLVKFIQKSDEGREYIKLVSQNQHHAPLDIPIRNISAIALIKASIRINSMS